MKTQIRVQIEYLTKYIEMLGPSFLLKHELFLGDALRIHIYRMHYKN